MKQVTAVSLEGALTILGGHAQRVRLLAALDEARGDLALDLSAIDACDSAGVQLLLAARRSVEERGGVLILGDVAPVVREVLQAYGLGALLREVEADAAQERAR